MTPNTRSPLAIREAEDKFLTLLLFAAATYSDQPSRAQSVENLKPHLRRAEEYMREHLAEPVTLGAITRTAGVSGRTLLRAFRRHRGTTTMGFLRILRMEAAHRELQAMEPGSTTVTEVATRCGFYELGRFSGRYRKTFGELPSETLTRAR